MTKTRKGIEKPQIGPDSSLGKNPLEKPIKEYIKKLAKLELLTKRIMKTLIETRARNGLDMSIIASAYQRQYPEEIKEFFVLEDCISKVLENKSESFKKEFLDAMAILAPKTGNLSSCSSVFINFHYSFLLSFICFFETNSFVEPLLQSRNR